MDGWMDGRMDRWMDEKAKLECAGSSLLQSSGCLGAIGHRTGLEGAKFIWAGWVHKNLASLSAGEKQPSLRGFQ